MATDTKSALHTPLCDLLGIRYPICQAGMGYVARSALAAAVSEAGGLGVIAAAHGSPDVPARGDPPRARSHRPAVRRRHPVRDHPRGRRRGRAVHRPGARAGPTSTLEERVPVLIAGLGNPGPVTAEAHRAGHQGDGPLRQREAGARPRRQRRRRGDRAGARGRRPHRPHRRHGARARGGRRGGADAGAGRGRHRRRPRPARPRSRWARSACGWARASSRRHEAYGHDNYKKSIVAIDEEGTVVHTGATGKPCRAIRNDFTREWEKRTAEIQPFPAAGRSASAFPPRSARARRATSTTATPRAARAPGSSARSCRPRGDRRHRRRGRSDIFRALRHP